MNDHVRMYAQLVHDRNPVYGWMGMVSIPYSILVELMGPVLEIGTIILLIWGMWLQVVDVVFFIHGLLQVVGYGKKDI